LEVVWLTTPQGPCKLSNIETARVCVIEAAADGAKVVVLPECFNSPYSTSAFAEYAEILDPVPPDKQASPTFYAMSRMAKDAGVYLIGGSIPERDRDSNKIFNTSVVFSPLGEPVGSHRKAHLFDVDFPGMTFRESNTLSPGKAITIVDLEEYGKIGLGICFDIRFPEPAIIAARSGAFCLIYPSAFNSTTGPLHWDLLSRSRALDNQVYVMMSSQSFDPGSGYPTWGHSMVVDLSGQVLTSASRDGTIVYANLSDELLQQSRRQLPLAASRRFDLYPDISGEGSQETSTFQSGSRSSEGR
jgi:predicted amidohydrolase